MFARVMLGIIALAGASYPAIYMKTQWKNNKKAAVFSGLFCAVTLLMGTAAILLY